MASLRSHTPLGAEVCVPVKRGTPHALALAVLEMQRTLGAIGWRGATPSPGGFREQVEVETKDEKRGGQSARTTAVRRRRLLAESVPQRTRHKDVGRAPSSVRSNLLSVASRRLQLLDRFRPRRRFTPYRFPHGLVTPSPVTVASVLWAKRIP
jgi:hypothetical protein